MNYTKVEGIVIGSISYKESSKIVYVYTKEGRISVRALGASKHKKGMLPLITTMNLLEINITDKEFPSAVDYTLINSFDDIKNDLKKNLWFSYILEIVSRLDADAPHDRIYALLKRTLELGSMYSPLMLGVMFQIKMTYGFGVGPVLKKCVVCGNTDLSYFSVREGGALCSAHRVSGVFSKKDLEDITKVYLFDIYNGNFDEIIDIDFINLFKIINIYYDTHINISLKGANSLIF